MSDLSMSASRDAVSRKVPGEIFYKEHVARFGRLLGVQPEQAVAEYGFTFLHSIDESDAAVFLQSQGLADENWHQSFMLAVASHRKGELDAAEKQYKQLLEHARDRKEIEYNLAALYMHRGDLANARKRLDVFEKWIAEAGKTAVSVDALAFIKDSKARIADLRSELEQN